MYVHLFKVGFIPYESRFFDKTLDQIFHEVSSAILASVGVQPGFNTHRIVDYVVYNVVFQKIEKARLPHEVRVPLRLSALRVKLIEDSSAFILAVYIIGPHR